MQKTITMDKYQSHFRKLDNFFSGKQQGAVRTDRNCPSCLQFVRGDKDF